MVLNGGGQNGCGEVDDISGRLSLGYGGKGRVDADHAVARSRLSQKSLIPVVIARKIWGTLESSTCSTLVAVFKKFISQSLVDRLTVKRKYITNSNGSLQRWWYVVRGKELDLAELEKHGKPLQHKQIRNWSLFLGLTNIMKLLPPPQNKNCNVLYSISYLLHHLTTMSVMFLVALRKGCDYSRGKYMCNKGINSFSEWRFKSYKCQ